MHIAILAALDNERKILAGDRSAERRFQEWKQTDPALSSIENLTGLLDVANNRSDLAGGDAALAALARRAPTDTLATQLLLHALLPGLKGIIRSFRPGRGADDLASEVVTIALERIRCYPFDRRPQRIAANVLLDVRQRIVRQQARQRRLADRLGRAVPFEEERIGSPDDPSSSEELIDLVSEAVRTGRVSPRGGRLILLYRVLGVTTPALAATEGRRPDAVERRRQRAEADLAAATEVA
jgi:DNA-directed RNA polymerase specialized sigma24 family protein